jgi:iron complex transport system ATP-binding protein
MTTAPVRPADSAPPRTRGADLRAEGLVLGYRDRVVVEGVDVAVPPGQVTVVVGANASGKSTLLRGLARLLQPRGGTVLLDGRDVHRIATREVAVRLGLLPQSPVAPEGLTAGDLVARGRSPHQRWWQQWSAEDERAVQEAMTATSTVELADRPVDELSGGQRQRVWLAMALAQETEVLLLDEPTTFLDLAHQVEVLDLVAELNATQGPHRRDGAARSQPRRAVRRPRHRHAGRRHRRHRATGPGRHAGAGPQRVRPGLPGRGLPGQRPPARGAEGQARASTLTHRCCTTAARSPLPV